MTFLQVNLISVYEEDFKGLRLLLGSMDTELKRADPHPYPIHLSQGFQELLCHPDLEKTNIALVLERRPLAKLEARLREVIQLDHGRHDLAVWLVLQHHRQLCCDGGVIPQLVLGPGTKLVLGHLYLLHQLLFEDLGVLVHSPKDANAPDQVEPVNLRDRKVIKDPSHHQVRELLREEVPGLP